MFVLRRFLSAIKYVVRRCRLLNFMSGVVLEYLKTSTMHCVKYIVDGNIHRIERVFWLICCLSSWILCCSHVSSTWYESQLRPVSVLLETDRMNWNTNYPAVTICQNGIEASLVNISNSNGAAILEELIFYSGRATFLKYCLKKSQQSGYPVKCPEINFIELQQKFTKSCVELLKHCTWNNADFDCCSTFLPLRTELGLCYSSASLHSTDARLEENYTVMSLNASSQKGNLMLNINASSSKVYIHSWSDIPNHNFNDDLIIDAYSNVAYWKYLKITATTSDDAVKETDLGLRRCRYQSEGNEKGVKSFQRYSSGGCLTRCREKRMLEYCGCLPHTQPGSDANTTCNTTGLLCITTNYKSLYVLSSKYSREKDKFLQCDCMEMCDHLDIEAVGSFYIIGNGSKTSQVTTVVTNLPTQRYRRFVVRDKLDEAVSFAGLVSLFLGTSFMTVFEVIIFLFIRPCSTNRRVFIQKK